MRVPKNAIWTNSKTGRKARILKRIKQRGVSESNPVTAKRVQLFAAVKSANGHDTRETRRLILELIKDGHPIGSNTNGYFYIRSAKECQRYMNRLMKQQMKHSQRIVDVYRAFFKS